MGLCEVLTVVFIVLKLIGKISWAWWQVLLPEIIAVGLYIVLILISASANGLFVILKGLRKDKKKK